MNSNLVREKEAHPAPPLPPQAAPTTSGAAESIATATGHVSPKNRARGQERPLFDGAIVRRAIVDSFRKLDPRHQARNPVMFVVEVGSVFTTALWIQALAGKGEARA